MSWQGKTECRSNGFAHQNHPNKGRENTIIDAKQRPKLKLCDLSLEERKELTRGLAGMT